MDAQANGFTEVFEHSSKRFGEYDLSWTSKCCAVVLRLQNIRVLPLLAQYGFDDAALKCDFARETKCTAKEHSFG